MTDEIRERMAVALEQGDVSTADMAAELGVDRSTVARYLNGSSQPRRAVLMVWALRCGVPFDWLVNG